MVYPLRRFIQQDLGISPQSFYATTQWKEAQVAQWEKQQVMVGQLPIGLLQDLSRYSATGENETKTLQRLLQYEVAHDRYWQDQSQRFVRILNLQRITTELRLLEPEGDVSRNLQVLVHQLDEAVDQAVTLQAEDGKKLPLQEVFVWEHQGQPVATALNFQVVILKTDLGKPLVYYEYLGKQPF